MTELFVIGVIAIVCLAIGSFIYNKKVKEELVASMFKFELREYFEIDRAINVSEGPQVGFHDGAG